MRKLLNILVITGLVILPVVLYAEVFSVSDPATDANAAVAETDPKWALAESGQNDGNLATAGYVKGAYNQTMKAINKVATTAGNAVKGVKVNGTELTKDANGKVDVLVSEGSTDGTISVNNTDVAVHGLGSAAFSETTAFDAAGAASGVQAAIEGKLDDGANGYDIDAKTLKVQGATVLTNAALTDYAKKTGVENTIKTATITATVPTLTAWGNDSSTGTVGITVASIAATYSEPAAPAQPQ